MLTCRPDHLVLGISAESIWGGGLEPSRRNGARVKARAGELPLTQAADALPAAFEALGIRKSVGLLTPHFPTADKRLRTFFGEFGLDVVRAVHLSCPGPVEIGHVSNAELIRSVREIGGQPSQGPDRCRSGALAGEAGPCRERGHLLACAPNGRHHRQDGCLQTSPR